MTALSGPQRAGTAPGPVAGPLGPVAALVARLTAETGGASVSLAGAVPGDGAMVAVGPSVAVPAPLTARTVRVWALAHRAALAGPGMHIGAWDDGAGTVWLEGSWRAPTLAAALAVARARGERAVWDVRTGTAVPVGGPES